MLQHVMLDLETLATTADAVIMSIGAVRFDPFSDKIDDEGFYASVSIDSNLDRNRRVDENTLLWWLKQPAAAQKVFHEEKDTLESALENFTTWFGKRADKIEVYSKGADFDIPMLAHAYKQMGWETPWAFWNARCFRTLSKLPFVKPVKIEHGVKHNALDDAIAQAREMQAIYAQLRALV